MMKRIISLALVCCVLLASLAVPAYASEVEYEQQQLLNVLEYATPNDSGNMYVDAGSDGKSYAKFKLPFGTVVRYVDMVVSVQDGPMMGAWLTVDGGTTPLTYEAISGSTYYRVYGVGNALWSDQFTIQINCEGPGKVQFYSLHFSPQPLQNWLTRSQIQLGSVVETQTSGSEYVEVSDVFESNPLAPVPSFQFYLGNWEWTRYDFMTFRVGVDAFSINSLSVSIGNKAVPFTVTYLEDPPSYNSVPDGSSYSNSLHGYFMDIIVDLRGVERTQTDNLVVYGTGQGHFARFALYYSCGYTPADLPTAELTWLQKISNGLDQMRNYVFGIRERFDTLLNNLFGDSDSADEFASEMESQAGAMEDAVDQMESVTKPPVDQIVVDVDDFVDPGDISTVGGIIGQLMANQLVLSMVMISITISLVSFVIYGKKG